MRTNAKVRPILLYRFHIGINPVIRNVQRCVGSIKKETFDYACINKALQKIKEAERQMNILESFLIFLTSLQSTRSTGWVIHGHRGRIRHFQQHLQDPI